MSEDTETLPPDLLATFDVESTPGQDDERTQIVVRLRRSYWHDHDGAYTRTELRYLKRHTCGFNIFDDDCSMVGADEALARIRNLHKCKDGIYQLIICNERRDWEIGYVDDWDYELIPFDSKKQA